MTSLERIVSNIILTILIGFGILAIFRWETTISIFSNYFFDETQTEQIYDQNAILLAGLHEGTSTPSFITVGKFEILLGKLARRCDSESKTVITRTLINTQRMIRKNDKEISLLKLGNILYQQIPNKITKATTCEETAHAIGLYSSL